MLSFNDYIVHLYSSQDPDVNCREITLQVTDDCCLKCSYCYQGHKGHRMMTKDTAKKAIDLLFEMYNKDEPNAFINKHTHGIILEFIGGEPLMNVSVIDFSMEYFINKCIDLNHEWLMNFRGSLSSNGMLYFEPEVQNLLHKYQNLISMTITIDGPKEMHDACRKDYEGKGSFDKAFAAWKDWNKRFPKDYISTKVTISPENLPYLDTIFKFFLENGCGEIMANPIFEEKWTNEQAKIYYNKLKELAKQLLNSDDLAYSSLFDFKHGFPLPLSETHNWCGGTAAMLAFDPDGLAYPCLRYMPSSLSSECKPIIIGDVNGIYNTPETKKIQCDLCAITRQSQSTQECINCHIASGCAWCSAYNYQSLGSVNKRSTNICWMHRARVLANVYYWNIYYRNISSEKRYPINLERQIATQIISNEEYDNLISLAMPGW